MFPEKDSSHQRNGKNCMESAQEMKSTTSNWGKASSSRNTKAKVLHLHRSMLTGGNINAPLHVRAWFIIQRVILIFVKCLSQSESNIRYESIYYHSYALKITIYQGLFNESWVKIYQMSLSQSESTILQESIILPFLPYIKDS